MEVLMHFLFMNSFIINIIIIINKNNKSLITVMNYFDTFAIKDIRNFLYVFLMICYK